MSEFAKTFLRERVGDDRQPREIFGIFGKHPGWNDHIEDLPLPTESMAAAKQLLYVQGIGSQISSGAWTRLGEDARLADFNHVFLWVRGRQFLAGRMWASRDGKRRTHFPMIALVQGINVDREATLDLILAQLESVAAGCQAARSADEVRELIATGWAGTREMPETIQDSTHATMGAVRGCALKLANDFREDPPRDARLPADPGDITRGIRFWSRVCTAVAPVEMPLLFLAPQGEAWLDVLVGEPSADAFFCLRAGLAARPISGAVTAQDSVEELDADDIIKSVTGGQSPGGERSWISRLLRH
jgi:hypothetical protein